VVLTSSCAAIYGDNADVAAAPEGKLTEEVWNTSSSLDHQPYSYSKAVAEREAWKIADAQSRWRLVVVNPSLVVGPGLNPNATSESFKLLRQFGDGSMKAGAPDLELGLVDVRDVAEAHLAAAYLPDAEGRHITCGHDTSLMKCADLLRPEYGDRYPLPTRTLPKWLAWLVGPIVDSSVTRKVVSKNLGHPFRTENAKSVRELGMNYRPAETSLREHFQQLVDSGAFAKR
jgi:dihydroflavonol-4-reductase